MYGSTKGYLDDVRYVSNYSSGGLEQRFLKNCLEHGVKDSCRLWFCRIKPTCHSSLTNVETNEQMTEACSTIMSDHNNDIDVIMLASVLDYVPAEKHTGKMRSREIKNCLLSFRLKKLFRS